MFVNIYANMVGVGGPRLRCSSGSGIVRVNVYRELFRMMMSTFHLGANDTARKVNWNTHPVWWFFLLTAARQG